MNVLHKIKALLYENFLTENPNDYIARVSSERTKGNGRPVRIPGSGF